MVSAGLEEALVQQLSDPLDVKLAESILGSANPIRIAQTLRTFCDEILGSHVSKCLHVELSVGASFGLVLADQRQVFIKVHKVDPTMESHANHASLSSLTAMSHVQNHLANAGFPVPRVLHAPVAFGEAIMTVDEFTNPGSQLDAHDAAIRDCMAATLAELVHRTEPCRAVAGLPNGEFFSSRRLYPSPHNALFDFEQTARGAKWIDQIAARVREDIQCTSGPSVLGHMDWSLKHLRFLRDEVVMVYDWDSLALDDELHAVGLAAATFPVTWDIPVKITPTQEEANAFVRAYEYARGRPFRTDEMKKLSACVTYAMTYVARCEHALDPHGEEWEGSFRQTLQTMRGPSYLGL